jgi:hypothetical protein
VLLSTLLHAILRPSHHLLNVLLQITNKLGLSKKKKKKKKKRQTMCFDFKALKLKLQEASHQKVICI